MTARTWVAVIGIVTLALSAPSGSVHAVEPAAPFGKASVSAVAAGRVVVRVRTPRGVPATVTLAGPKRRVVAKRPRGTLKVVTLRLPVGRYRLLAPSVTVKGRLYTATPRMTVRVGSRTRVPVRVRYRKARAAFGLHTTGMTQSSIDLAWRAPAGTLVEVRRLEGDVAPATRRAGQAVAVQGSRATDAGLQPGTTYAYAVFSDGSNPLTVVAGTLGQADSGTAAYVSAPSTLIADGSETNDVVATGEGVRVTLRPKVPVPLVGAAVVLPVSATLPGGYLGRVSRISANGRVLDLVPGGIADAFDFYAVSVADLNTTSRLQPAVASSRLRSVPKCLGGSGGQQVTFSPRISLGGHFTGVISTYPIDTYLFGTHYVMTGASIDARLTATATGAMAVQVSAALKCGIPFTAVMTPITTTPVPLSFYFTPVAEISIGGAVEMANLGMTVTAGVEFEGTIGLTSAPSFTGSPVLSVSPLTPVVTANAAVGLTLGGEVIVGPGAGTSSAGVIAGVGGKLNPLDAKFGPVFAVSDSRFDACLKAEAAFTRELNLSVKAWLGSLDVSRSVTIDAFKGSTQYPGSPWYFPNDCSELPPDPGGDVIGTGVDLQEDFTDGASEQWGHLDGFALGARTWVLSTGRIADAVGSPADVASSDMSQPGNSSLGDLVGNHTHDAAVYRARIIPRADTLHIKYVFASEEYPEFVGSIFNDVMAVFVDGVNCAVAPGTSQPVSVNSINKSTNSAWFIDNSSGAVGLSTSFDGVTKPLQCDVPVTPGQPVVVEVGVADTKDPIFDSAVALLDEGIWAD